MATETTIDAASNPALATKLVEEALSPKVESKPEPAVVISPPDGLVTLPGGLADPFEGLIKTAEVRELTGSDEEAVARVNDAGKSLLTILERAVVKIGDKPATKDVLDSLLAGDREMLLLAIRKATFGSEVIIGPGYCPACQFEQEFNINLEDDVHIKEVENGEYTFVVKCKVGSVEVSLPNGSVQKALVNATNKNSAELDTLLLKGCILSINGNPLVTNEVVKDLSIKDRRDILKAITDRNPGPQLGDIKKSCKSCGQEVPLPLTLAELFQE